MIDGNKIVITYAAQIYSVLIGIVTLPLYIKILGLESFGLIGFFSTLQAIFAILDIGLGSVVTRESSKFSANNNLNYYSIIRIIRTVFFIFGALGLIILLLMSGYLSSEWLKYKVLTYQDVKSSLNLMAGIIVLRWISGYYKGIIIGFENIKWYGFYNITSTTFRFVLVIPVIYFYTDIIYFFLFQLIVSIIEFIVLYKRVENIIPLNKIIKYTNIEKKYLKEILLFSGGIALTSALWIIVSNTDKIIISRLVDLSQYGDFIAAITLASGILILNTPISTIALPRLTILHAEKNEFSYREMYKFSTQLLSIVSISAAVFIAIYAKEILFVWMNKLANENMSTILKYYAIGNSVMALTAIGYYLQFSIGNLKYHIIGSIFFVIILIPIMYIFINSYGVVGSGYAWFLTNSIYFLIWIPIIHKRYLKGMHLKWMYEDIIIPLMTAAITGYTLSIFFEISEERVFAGFQLLIIGGVILIATIIGCSRVRSLLFKIKII